MTGLELALTATAKAPGAAREAVRSWLAGRACDQDALDTAALLVTELVTNAVFHGAQGRSRLTLEEVVPGVMRVAVDDNNSDLPRRQTRVPDPNATGGRGLYLIEAMATAWGWEFRRSGKRVWFELDYTTRNTSDPRGRP